MLLKKRSCHLMAAFFINFDSAIFAFFNSRKWIILVGKLLFVLWDAN